MHFTPAGPDSRVEQLCPACGGTGTLADALYGKLTGEDVARKEANREAIIWRIPEKYRTGTIAPA